MKGRERRGFPLVPKPSRKASLTTVFMDLLVRRISFCKSSSTSGSIVSVVRMCDIMMSGQLAVKMMVI